MNLVSDQELENSAVVANCNMNRERNLRGSNGYERDLRFDPLEYLSNVAAEQGRVKWLDLCCGSGKALIEASAEIGTECLPISIIGVDLVGMFDANESSHLKLIEAPLSQWQPKAKFDLITCVHGLHYIGNKLRLISRAVSWLTPNGRFAANLDRDNLRLENGSDHALIDQLRGVGMQYCARQKILQCIGSLKIQFEVQYLGADDQAGPNYTGQPAVNSHYRV